MKNICKKWDYGKVFQPPYDPATGAAFLAVAMTLAVLFATRSKADWWCTWQFILSLLIVTLAFSVLVLCMVVRNAMGKGGCLTWLESDRARKTVWFAMVAFVVAALIISMFELFGLKDAAGFKHNAMNLAIVVVGGLWVLIWLLGTRTFTGLPPAGDGSKQGSRQQAPLSGPPTANDTSTALEIKVAALELKPEEEISDASKKERRSRGISFVLFFLKFKSGCG